MTNYTYLPLAIRYSLFAMFPRDKRDGTDESHLRPQCHGVEDRGHGGPARRRRRHIDRAGSDEDGNPGDRPARRHRRGDPGGGETDGRRGRGAGAARRVIVARMDAREGGRKSGADYDNSPHSASLHAGYVMKTP